MKKTPELSMVTTMFHANGLLSPAHSNQKKSESPEQTSSMLFFFHSSFLFLLAFLLLLVVLAQAAGARGERKGEGEPQTLYVGLGAEYQSIQEAIDHASNGDAIVLENGSYRENIVSERLIQITGNSTQNCIIQGNASDMGNDTVISGAFSLTNLSVIPDNYDVERGLTAIHLFYPHPENFPENLTSIIVEGVLVRNASTGLVIEGPGGESASLLVNDRMFLMGLNISQCETGIYITGLNGTTIEDSKFLVDDVGIRLEDAHRTKISATDFVSEHGEGNITNGTGLLSEKASMTRVGSCSFHNLSKGVVLGDEAQMGVNTFAGNDVGIYIENGSKNTIFSNFFDVARTYDIVVEGSKSIGNSVRRNLFTVGGFVRLPKIQVQEGVNLTQNDYLNVFVFGGDGALLTGGEVKFENQQDGVIYATPHYGGVGTTTFSGVIFNQLVTTGLWYGETQFMSVSTTISIYYEGWEETKVFPTSPDARSSPVEFRHPLNADVTVKEENFIEKRYFIKDYSKKTGNATISFWVDNLEIGDAGVLVEVYVFSLANDTEEKIYSDRILVKGRWSTEVELYYTFKKGDYQIKVVLNSDGKIYETNTTNNIITSDVFTMERGDEDDFNETVLYIGAGAFLVLVFIFFGILFFAYLKAGEEIEKERGKAGVGGAGREKRKVLVAYGELGTRISLKRELEEEGYDVSLAKTSFELLDLIKNEKFDAVVCSALFSGMPLQKLVAKIKEAGAGAPIIILQGRDAREIEGTTSFAFSGAVGEIGDLRKQLRKLLPGKEGEFVFECSKCEAKLKAKKPGASKCPMCGEVNYVGKIGEKEEVKEEAPKDEVAGEGKKKEEVKEEASKDEVAGEGKKKEKEVKEEASKDEVAGEGKKKEEETNEIEEGATEGKESGDTEKEKDAQEEGTGEKGPSDESSAGEKEEKQSEFAGFHS